MDEEVPASTFEEPQQTVGMDLSVSSSVIKQNVEESLENNINPELIKDEKQEVPIALPLKKKRKKGRKIKRSKEYPKFYRNAYVRYCEEVRPKVSELNPSLDSVEITKLVASKWCSLSSEEKQPYLDDARIDKERYERELEVYKTLNPDECEDKPHTKKQKVNKKVSDKGPNDSNPLSETNHVDKLSEQPSTSKISDDIPSTSSASVNSSSTLPVSVKQSTSQVSLKRDEDILKVFIGQNCEIPIFTDVFLEHNKCVETELKALRKNNIEIEQQNAVLMKHIENMENGIVKVESEIADVRKKNMQLEVYLTKLRVILSANFNCLQIPGWKGGATVENIDKYMTDLEKSSTGTLNKARDILKKIDLQI